MTLLFQAMHSRDAVDDRFYRTLYALLLAETAVTGSPRLSMFLSLVFRAVKTDARIDRVAAFVKRLLQVACGATGALPAAILVVVSALIKAKPALWARLSEPEDGGESDVESLHDASDSSDADESDGGGGGGGGSDSDSDSGSHGEGEGEGEGGGRKRKSSRRRPRTTTTKGAEEEGGRGGPKNEIQAPTTTSLSSQHRWPSANGYEIYIYTKA